MKTLPIFATALAPLAAYACECGMPHTMNAPGEDAGGLLASIRQEYIHGDSLYSGEKHIANNAGEYLRTARTSLLASAGIGGGFSLFVSPQYIVRDYRAERDGAVRSGIVNGFGDLPFGVNYLDCIAHGETTHLHAGFSAAVTAPTGDTGFLREEAEEHSAAHPGEEHGGVHGHDLALGSGAWGGVFAARFLLEHGDLLLEGNVHYSLRPEGDYGYDYADSFGWNLLAGGFVHEGDIGATALLLSVTGDHDGNDRIDGVVHERTNHDMIYAGPVVRHNAPGAVTLEARVEMPVYIRTGDAHLAASWRTQASVSVTF